jgi:ParB-like chromosome segregation protein Spo0J
MPKKQIKIKCKAADMLAIDDLVEFQGKLKKITKPNLEKLKSSILKKGFIAPFFIWDNAGDKKLLDGHQRLKALFDLKQEGYDIPLLPVAYVEADNEKDAKEKLLSIASQYGDFNKHELVEWFDNIDEEIKNDLRLMNLDKEIDLKLKQIKEELVPYDKIHLLISTNIKNINKLNELIEQIKLYEWAEYEQSQN